MVNGHSIFCYLLFQAVNVAIPLLPCLIMGQHRNMHKNTRYCITFTCARTHTHTNSGSCLSGWCHAPPLLTAFMLAPGCHGNWLCVYVCVCECWHCVENVKREGERGEQQMQLHMQKHTKCLRETHAHACTHTHIH